MANEFWKNHFLADHGFLTDLRIPTMGRTIPRATAESNPSADYAIRLRSMALITGEGGSGKSTALRFAMSRLHPSEYRRAGSLGLQRASGYRHPPRIGRPLPQSQPPGPRSFHRRRLGKVPPGQCRARPITCYGIDFGPGDRPSPAAARESRTGSILRIGGLIG